MARPLKYGLDYFPLDVDFFEDDKIQFVSSRFDEKGELIAIKLLCKIYRSGYFIKWDEDAALLFSKGAGRSISPSLANDVVNELIKRGFFHQGLFERFAVLTSNGIQKRYIKICQDAKRKDWEIEEKYDVDKFTPEETPLNPEETPKTPEESTQRKVKESKGKKSIREKPEKIEFRHNVLLSEAENERLVSEHGQAFVDACYDYLSSYKIEKDYKTKDDNLSIRRWVTDAVRKKQRENGSPNVPAQPQVAQLRRTIADPSLNEWF